MGNFGPVPVLFSFRQRLDANERFHSGKTLTTAAPISSFNALECNGNVSKAAPKLGLHRNTWTRAIAQLELDISAFRPSVRRPPASVTAAYRKTISRP